MIGEILEIPLYKLSLFKDNCLPCNGQTVSKTKYPELFKVLQYWYGGSGDNFNLPLLGDDRATVGFDGSKNTTPTVAGLTTTVKGGFFEKTVVDANNLLNIGRVGNTGGAKTVKLYANQYPRHFHVGRYGYGVAFFDGGSKYYPLCGFFQSDNIPTGEFAILGTAIHLNTGSGGKKYTSGCNTPHENMMKSMKVVKVIVFKD
jgi:microcystin-dependent protein